MLLVTWYALLIAGNTRYPDVNETGKVYPLLYQIPNHLKQIILILTDFRAIRRCSAIYTKHLALLSFKTQTVPQFSELTPLVRHLTFYLHIQVSVSVLRGNIDAIQTKLSTNYGFSNLMLRLLMEVLSSVHAQISSLCIQTYLRKCIALSCSSSALVSERVPP